MRCKKLWTLQKQYPEPSSHHQRLNKDRLLNDAKYLVRYPNLLELRRTIPLNWRRRPELILSSPARVTTCVAVLGAEEVTFIIGSSNICLTVAKYQNIILTLISKRIPIPQIMSVMRLHPQKVGIRVPRAALWGYRIKTSTQASFGASPQT